VQFGLLAAIYFRGVKQSSELVDLIARARRVPSLPAAYADIQREIYGIDPSIERIGRIIRQDPGMSLKILQFVNAPHFGLKREIGDVADAAALLGLNTISNLVLAIGVFAQSSVIDQRFMASLWSEALQVSAIARSIGRDLGLGRSDIEEAQLAGLLHDIGDMILFQNWRDRYTRIDMSDRVVSELTEFGATHCDIGAVLCSSWGLRRSVADGVRYHHVPSSASLSEPSVITAVHAARALIDGQGDIARAPLDWDHLEAVGVAGRVETWLGILGA